MCTVWILQSVGRMQNRDEVKEEARSQKLGKNATGSLKKAQWNEKKRRMDSDKCA